MTIQAGSGSSESFEQIYQGEPLRERLMTMRGRCPQLIALDLVSENIPASGAWRIKCPCGADLTFGYRDPGMKQSTLVVTHGAGLDAVQQEWPSFGPVMVRWAIGAFDPLGVWLDQVHAGEREASR